VQEIQIQRNDFLLLLNKSISRNNSEEQESLTRDTLSHLTQTTEAALARTGVVSELSKLLIQLQQPTNSIKDAWFVTDLDGICLYMNPVAELFCGSHFIDNEHVPLQNIFASLLLRIRNRKEVQHYLQELTSNNPYKQTLRFTVALETLEEPLNGADVREKGAANDTIQTYKYESGHTALLRSMLREDAPSDMHYQCISHALHNSQGHITAYALQISDITTQVRDEKNKSALLSSVSHDLRTPLTTIKAAVTGLLQKDIPWDEQMRQEMLEDIDVETDHLTVLVNSLVEMSRIEMGALLLEKEWCDVIEVINEVLARTKRVLGGRRVQVNALTDLPLLYIDRVQIGRVFYNLIENAARYSPEQSEMTIKVYSVSEGTIPTMMRIALLDEGRGIPQQEHERIFKPFYGLHSDGSGLGLAICRGIVEAHQGHIWVENVEKGSCFIFTLPVEAALTR
jgi:signal transduction histidine kinase